MLQLVAHTASTASMSWQARDSARVRTRAEAPSKTQYLNDPKSLFLLILLEKLRIPNFEMWSLDVIFVSQKKSPATQNIEFRILNFS